MKKLEINRIWFLVLVLFTMALASCLEGNNGGGNGKCNSSYRPIINPWDFSAIINNPYLTFKPGTTFVYEGETEDGTEHIETMVTDRTRQILGVDCVVVRDRVWLEGDLTEDTLDWYAQDPEGNVWYFGEYSQEIENGKVVGTEGSWEAGVDCAQPGIVMPGSPYVGQVYRQEYKQGEAEDMGSILSLDESITVKYGSFEHCLKTADYTPLEPKVVENKYYCPAVGGVVFEEMVQGGNEKAELIDIK